MAVVITGNVFHRASLIYDVTGIVHAKPGDLVLVEETGWVLGMVVATQLRDLVLDRRIDHVSMPRLNLMLWRRVMS